jgi:predicted RNA-binding protein with PIN domain
MTRFSRSELKKPTDVERIAADLRRQREDLNRQKDAGRTSSTETRSILEKLEDLRRRSEALNDADTNDRT